MFEKIEVDNYSIKMDKERIYIIEDRGNKIFEGGWEIACGITESTCKELHTLFKNGKEKELKEKMIKIRNSGFGDV